MRNRALLSKRNFIKIISLFSLATIFNLYSREETKIVQNNSKKQIKKDLIKWDSIELHRTGTKGDEQTAFWLADEIRKCNLEPQLDSFSFTKRTPGKCEVTNGTFKAKGLPMFDGGSTSSKGITEVSGSLNEKNVIAVTKYSSSTMDEASLRLNEARKEDNHLAIIAIADVAPNAPGLAVLNAESYRKPFGPPVLQVATKEQDWLLKLNKNEELTVSVQLTDEKSEALNIQTKIEGKDKSLNPLVIMTPKSGWWTCTSERGGGIAIWLNAMRYFAQNKPNRNVIFTANTGHELSHIGLDHFLENNPSLVKEAHAWVHLGANFAAKKGNVLWQASNKDYMNIGIEELTSKGLDEVQTWPISSRTLGEARNIYDGGGQFISLLGSNSLFHHPEDRWPEAIDMAKLEKLNSFMLKMITDMANSNA